MSAAACGAVYLLGRVLYFLGACACAPAVAQAASCPPRGAPPLEMAGTACACCSLRVRLKPARPHSRAVLTSTPCPVQQPRQATAPATPRAATRAPSVTLARSACWVSAWAPQRAAATRRSGPQQHGEQQGSWLACAGGSTNSANALDCTPALQARCFATAAIQQLALCSHDARPTAQRRPPVARGVAGMVIRWSAELLAPALKA